MLKQSIASTLFLFTLAVFACLGDRPTPSLRASEIRSSIDDTQSLALLVKTLANNDSSAIQAALMRGMLSSLEGRRNVQTPQGWSDLKPKLSTSDDPHVRELTRRLSQIFGDRQAIQASLVILQDQTAAPDTRRKALRLLLALQNEEASSLLETLLDEPGLRLDSIRGYALVENPVAPTILLQRYEQFNPEHRRAAIETLATRKRYAQALCAALKSKKIAREEVPVHVARTLREMVGSQQFAQVYGEIKSIGVERENQIAHYKKLLTPNAIAKANASRGRVVFKKTCASCHLLYGDGGTVGPDLTGSNRANLDYILLNSVDPSYDVPSGYQMVTVMTVDGRFINGVVDEEDSAKLVLKTAEQPRVVIAKPDIEERKISKKSIMPDGQLDEMKPQEVIDLIKYLQTTEQVEMLK